MSKIVSNMQAAGCINPDASQDLMFFLFYGTKFLEKKTNRNSGDIRFAIPKKRAAISINRFNLPMLLGSSNGAQVRKPKKCDASILTTTSPIGGMIFFPNLSWVKQVVFCRIWIEQKPPKSTDIHPSKGCKMVVFVGLLEPTDRDRVVM